MNLIKLVRRISKRKQKNKNPWLKEKSVMPLDQQRLDYIYAHIYIAYKYSIKEIQYDESLVIN